MLTVTLTDFGGMIEEEFAEHTGRSPGYDSVSLAVPRARA